MTATAGEQPTTKHLRKKPTPTPSRMRTSEAAARLGISEWKVRKLVHEGKLRYFQDVPGSPWLFDEADLDAYANSNTHTEICAALLTRLAVC
jgi:excisionase family DNA binding protein